MDQQTPEPEQAEDNRQVEDAVRAEDSVHAEDAAQAEDTGRNDERPPGADPRIEDLRDMEEKGDHLGEVIEDARGAVAAAHRANSMRPADAAGHDAEEQGPQASG
jgi:hypothetical protein